MPRSPTTDRFDQARALPTRRRSRLGQSGATPVGSQGVPPGCLLGRLVYLILAGTVVYGIWFGLTGPGLHVRKVEVVGARLVSSDAVRRAAGLDGASPFLVSTAEVEERVRALGAPAQARVTFRLPDMATIQIVERRPAYVWVVDKRRFLVGDDGVVLSTATTPSELLEVVDDERRTLTIGATVDRRALVTANYLARALPAAVGVSASSFRLSHERGLVVVGPKNILLVLGDDQNLEARLADLKPTLDAALASRPLPSMVDVRVLHHPYFR